MPDSRQDSRPDTSDFFVSTEWLATQLGAADLVVIDGSFIMPDQKRDTRAEYLAGHIPGAVFFDIDAIADHTTELPHMLPTSEAFAAAMHDLGISEKMRLVVYDSAGLEGAPPRLVDIEAVRRARCENSPRRPAAMAS